MLSAYWGDPVGYQHQEKKGISKILKRFNVWFDHQADRYGNVIAWALHHRKWMTAIAVLTFIAALVLQFTVGTWMVARHSRFGGLLRNPMVWSTLLGFAFALTHPPIPDWLMPCGVAASKRICGLHSPT